MSDSVHVSFYAAIRRYACNNIMNRAFPSERRIESYVWLTYHAPSPAHIPCIVVAEEDDNHDEFYTVQVMTVPNQAGSFVTETVRTGHALHSFFLERVGALNMAGDFEEIAGIGENLSKKHYNVYINKEQHEALCSLGTKESL